MQYLLSQSTTLLHLIVDDKTFSYVYKKSQWPYLQSSFGHYLLKTHCFSIFQESFSFVNFQWKNAPLQFGELTYLFWESFNLWRLLLMIVFYYQTKTLISFWCRQGMNSRFLIQPSKTLPVELTGTHIWHISLYIFITTLAFWFWEQWEVISTPAWLDLHVFILLFLIYIYIYIY